MQSATKTKGIINFWTRVLSPRPLGKMCDKQLFRIPISSTSESVKITTKCMSNSCNFLLPPSLVENLTLYSCHIATFAQMSSNFVFDYNSNFEVLFPMVG